MRISDWSSDVCSSDLARAHRRSRRLVEEGDRFFRNIGAVAEEIDRHAPVRRIGAFGRAVGAQRLLHARLQTPVDIAVLAVRFAMKAIYVELEIGRAHV